MYGKRAREAYCESLECPIHNYGLINSNDDDYEDAKQNWKPVNTYNLDKMYNKLIICSKFDFDNIFSNQKEIILKLFNLFKDINCSLAEIEIVLNMLIKTHPQLYELIRG